MKRNPIETAAGETFGGEPEPEDFRPLSVATIILAFIAGLAPTAIFLWFVLRGME